MASAAGFRSVGSRLAALALLCSALGVVTATGSASAVVPGQVGSIIFASQRDGNSAIYAMNADGTDQTRLTNNAAGDGQPVFSPDGRKIAFESNRSGNSEIYIMNADGTDQTRLTNAAGEDYAPAFSPDGQKIAFEANRDGNSEIYIMNADGTGQTRLTNNAVSDGQPVFSPDGGHIVFDSGRGGNNDIYAIDTDGNNPVRLTTSSGFDGSPAVSPDGTKIAFYSYRDADGEIYIMNADGTGQTRLTTHDGPDTEPAFSPDGQKIAFSRWGSGYDPDVFAMSPTGTNVVNLTAITGSDNSPDWQPVPPDPTVTKSRTEASVNPGQTIHYDIAVRNNAAVALTGVTLTDLHATCAAPPATIAVAATVHISCTHVAALADLGTYTNTATVDTDQTGPVDSNQVSTTVADTTASSGEVSGTVADIVSGTPVAGAWVALLRTVDYSIEEGVVADGDGSYRARVPVGAYYLYVIDPNDVYKSRFYGPPTTVTVTADTTVDADPQLAPTRGSITGTVVDDSTGDPIPGAWAIAINAATGAPETAVQANAGGQYTLTGLRAGHQLMVYLDPTGRHRTEFYANSPDASGAVAVAVLPGGSTQANGSLPTQVTTPRGAALTGTISDSASADRLDGVLVIAMHTSDFRLASATATDPDGHYYLNVAPGDYRLVFLDPTGTHNTEWHNNQPYDAIAASATVTAPAVTNAALDPTTGAIVGRVSDDPSGDALPGAWIIAVGPSGVAAGAISRPAGFPYNGSYYMSGLPAGTYRAAIIDPTGTHTPEYWDDSHNYPGATVFAVAGGDTTIVNAALTHRDLPPVFADAWGAHGNANSQFAFPWAVATDPANGDVYVADTFNHRIQKFSSTGAYLTQWGTLGTGDAQFNHPVGVAVDPSGNVYVTDQDNHRVQKFTSTGGYLTQWGTNGAGNSQFVRPVGIAVDASTGNVYVGDYNNRIQKFSPNGTYLAQFATTGDGTGELNDPAGVTVDPSGNVYVADYGNDRIEKFTSTGAYLTQWGTTGTGNGQFQFPYGLTVDPSGNVLVADAVNHRIQKFTPTGAYLTQWGTLGAGNGQFNLPHGVAVGPSGSIYVADQTNHRIQRFVAG